MSNIQSIIDEAFERRAQITPRNVETHVKDAVWEAIDLLDTGKARVAEKQGRPVGREPVAQEGGVAVLPHRG